MSEDQQAVRLILNLLPSDAEVTLELIRDGVRDVLELLARRSSGALPSEEELVRQVEARVTVRQDEAVSLTDDSGHLEWLPAKKADIEWTFWERYRRYLEDVQLLPRAVIWRLDETTDSILRKLEDPARPGRWDRRGLVVGQVQSGKTSNYTGLVSKAADAGYKLILVLAGIHNSLRSQTQLRLDEGFLGFDSQFQARSDEGASHFIGAGAMRGFPRLWAASLTTSSDGGDFRQAKARSMALPVVEMPVLLVVKKNAGILENIYKWVTGMHGEPDGASDRQVVRDIPLLVIDDEADNASINTGKIDDDDAAPTAVNKAIRKLLHGFERSAYVGYTATPYANIYASIQSGPERWGDDLFPRSFIESLRPPSNYFGPERVFGLSDDDEQPLPIHRAIRDHDDWMPVGHRKDWTPPSELPPSLVRAVRSFVLSCAARRARGQITDHNSMLLHVTRFQDVQDRVAEQVGDLLHLTRDRLRWGDGDRPDALLAELEQLWDEDYVPTTSHWPEERAGRPSWAQVRAELIPAVMKIEMRTMNGRAKDALEYYENRKEGLSVIAVGGNKLSRGLTLEGLTVSYYLRASKMYDTLMQMGRWFGYRPAYEDLCRLYTTPLLRSWYREITEASEELRRELEEMALQGGTPEQYGLRVRTSPAGLSITAPNRMRGALRVRLSFSGGIPETVLFDVRRSVLENNLGALQELVAELDGRERVIPGERDNLIWTQVPGDLLAEVFFERYRSDPSAWRVRPELIAAYLRRCVLAGELRSCTVALISNTQPPIRGYAIDGYEVGLTTRALLPDGDGSRREDELRNDGRYAIRRVLSPLDELIDLSDEQRDEALKRTIAAFDENPGRRTQSPKLPSGPALRGLRHPDQGLLLIYVLDNDVHRAEVTMPMVGFAMSFPHSRSDIAVEYAVNPVWQQLQLEGLLLDDDEDD